MKKIPIKVGSNPKLGKEEYADMITKLTEMARGFCNMYRRHVKSKGYDVDIDFAKGFAVEDKSGDYPAGSHFYYEEWISDRYSSWTKWCNNYEH